MDIDQFRAQILLLGGLLRDSCAGGIWAWDTANVGMHLVQIIGILHSHSYIFLCAKAD